MTDFVHKQDRLYAPFAVASGANAIVVEDSVDGVLTCPVTVAAPGETRERYYNHLDSSEDGTHGYAFLKGVVDSINAQATTETYSIASSTPSGSSLTKSGITITRSGAGNFTLRFDHASWTLDPRLLGWGAGQSTSVGASIAIASPYSLYGVWQSHTLADNAASQKARRVRKGVVLSSDDMAQALPHEVVRREYRRFVYDYVSGAHAKTGRGKDAASADTAGLPTGDVHNAFELWWELASVKGADDKMAQIIVAHNIGADGYETVFDDEHDEIVRLSDADEIASPEEILRRQRLAGEFYQVSFDTQIVSGSYDQ